jgi:hypothetical protein
MKISPYLKTIILVAIVLAFTVQKGNGLLLVLLVLFFLIYLILNAVRMTRRSVERKDRGIRMAIWSVALVLSSTAQVYWSVGSRSDADLASQSVLAYKERTGTYPVNLRDAGLDDSELQKKWRIRYSMKDGEPRLTYPAPVMPLTMNEYDFNARAWRKNAY